MEDHRIIHASSLVVDGHADTIAKVMHTGKDFFAAQTEWHVDFPRLRRGGIGIQFMAAYTPPKHQKAEATLFALRMISCLYDVLENSRGRVIHVLTRGDVASIRSSKKVGFLLSIEGGSPLAGDISLLEVFFRLGVRAFTLTHSPRNELGDGTGVRGRPRGLTRFGKSVVRELFKLGMIVDVAHLAKPGVRDAVRLATGPLISSHTGIRRLCNIRRNLDDAELRWIAETGGVVGIDFLPSHLRRGRSRARACLDDVIRHVEHVANLVGIDHVGLGSDFDGFHGKLSGVEDVSCYPNVTRKLLDRGFKPDEVKKILGGNFARVICRILPPNSS